MVDKKFIHVKKYVRRMPKKTNIKKQEKMKLIEEKEKKMKAEYKHRVEFDANRNLPYEEWKKWYLRE